MTRSMRLPARSHRRFRHVQRYLEPRFARFGKINPIGLMSDLSRRRCGMRARRNSPSSTAASRGRQRLPATAPIIPAAQGDRTRSPRSATPTDPAIPRHRGALVHGGSCTTRSPDDQFSAASSSRFATMSAATNAFRKGDADGHPNYWPAWGDCGRCHDRDRAGGPCAGG